MLNEDAMLLFYGSIQNRWDFNNKASNVYLVLQKNSNVLWKKDWKKCTISLGMNEKIYIFVQC